MVIYDIVTQTPLEEGRDKLLNIVGTNRILWEYGCKVQSQNEEDGVLYYIFANIGAKYRTALELCAGDGIECNSANLILHHGFRGYLVDGNPEPMKEGVKFYRQRKCLDRVKYLCGWIDKESIHTIIEYAGIKHQPIDLLVMDIDGNDFWILKEIIDNDLVKPRVICVEYQDIIGPDKALTIPYDPEFRCTMYDLWNGPNYCGASLQAFIHLLKNKYAFVGCEGLGFNGFFVLREELGEHLKEMTDVTPCFAIDKVEFGMKYRWPRTAGMDWVDVTNLP
jgi:hypothetical protein